MKGTNGNFSITEKLFTRNAWKMKCRNRRQSKRSE